MGYFPREVVAPIVDYYARPAHRPRARPAPPEACFRELYQRSLWWGRVGSRALGPVRASRWRSGTSPARRPAGPSMSCSVGRPTTDCRSTRRAGREPGRSRRRSTQAQQLRLPRFRGLKLGTGFDGRPGASRPARQPPYGTWYARHDRAADRRRAGQVRRAPRGARARTSSSRPTATPSRSVSPGRARRPSTWRTRSRSSTCCSSRSRSATTTLRATRSCAAGTRVPIAGGECLTGVDEFRH